MFRPAIRASGVSICRLEPNCSAGPNAAAVKARPHHGSHSTHPCGATTATTITLFNSLLSQGKNLRPVSPGFPGLKGHFPGCNRTFPFKPQHQGAAWFSSRSRHLTAITTQTICIACHNARKPSAILQRAALTAGNKPRSAFPKNNPLFKCTNITHTLGSELLLPMEHQDDDKTPWTHWSRTQPGVCHPSAPRPPEPCRTFCRCWSSHIQQHTELPETHENLLNRT